MRLGLLPWGARAKPHTNPHTLPTAPTRSRDSGPTISLFPPHWCRFNSHYHAKKNGPVGPILYLIFTCNCGYFVFFFFYIFKMCQILCFGNVFKKAPSDTFLCIPLINVNFTSDLGYLSWKCRKCCEEYVIQGILLPRKFLVKYHL